MNINQRQLKMFTTLAELGHFSKASEVLCITQPALSRAIQDLESQLNCTLFIRTTRQLLLSEHGKKLLPIAQRLLRDMSEITTELRKQNHSSISVAVGTAFGSTVMPTIIKCFQKKYPHNKIILTDANSGDITAKTVSGQVDIGIGSPIGDISSLCCQELIGATIGFLANPEFYDLENADLEHIEFPLLCEPDGTSIMSVLSANGSDLVHKMEGAVSLSSLSMQLAFAHAGVGVAVLSSLGASHPLAKSMCFVPVKPAIERKIFLMTLRSKPVSFAAKAFISVVYEVLQKCPISNNPLLSSLTKVNPKVLGKIICND